MGAVIGTRPFQKVAIQENTCTALGIATAKLAAETNSMACRLRPAVNMWCAHSAKLMNPTATSAITMARCPTSGVRAIAGTIMDTMPAAGRKMM